MSPELCSIISPIADLRDAPDGARVRQLLHGEGFLVEKTGDGWALGEAAKDGYRGHVAIADLGPAILPTHRVRARASHIYPAPDIKSGARTPLPFGALIEIRADAEAQNGFLPLAKGGFIPARHLAPIDECGADPVAIAEQFLGVPYLWGGNSIWGIDCSGLVQAALLACGIDCPADSGPQSREVGRALEKGETLVRGDLLFWKGHVAMAMDAGRMIHANAHHMSVVIEPITEAIARIDAAGDGPVIARRRPAVPS